jgi:predicted nucleic acid-binding Zn finger protein
LSTTRLDQLVDASATLGRWPNKLRFVIYIGEKVNPQYIAEWRGLELEEIFEVVKRGAWEQLRGLDPAELAKWLEGAFRRLGPEARQKVLDDMKERLGLRCDGEGCIEEAVRKVLKDVEGKFDVISHIALTNERVERVEIDWKDAREILSVLYEVGRGGQGIRRVPATGADRGWVDNMGRKDAKSAARRGGQRRDKRVA